MGMKEQSRLGMLMMMAALSNPEGIFEENTKVKKPIEKIIPKGLKEFFYGVNSVFALNQKNADKKARKKGYLCA